MHAGSASVNISWRFKTALLVAGALILSAIVNMPRAQASSSALLDTSTNAFDSAFGFDFCDQVGFAITVPATTTIRYARVPFAGSTGIDGIELQFFSYSEAVNGQGQTPYAGLTPVGSLGLPVARNSVGKYTGSVTLTAGDYFLVFKGRPAIAGLSLGRNPGTATITGSFSFRGESAGKVRQNYCSMFDGDYFPLLALYDSVQNDPPAQLGSPFVAGNTVEGETLYGYSAGWDETPTVSSKWQRCNGAGSNCVDIPGQTSTTYVLTSADVGATIRFFETAVNAGGTVNATYVTAVIVAAPLPPTPPQAPAPPPPPVVVFPDMYASGFPVIEQVSAGGQVSLRCMAPQFSEKPDSLTYSWHEGAVSVGQGSELTLPAANAERTLTCSVTGTNEHGSATSGADVIVGSSFSSASEPRSFTGGLQRSSMAVYFGFNSSRLESAQRKRLSAFITSISGIQTVSVEGFAQASVGKAPNAKLGLARAQEVAKTLQILGIQGTISATSAGRSTMRGAQGRVATITVTWIAK